MSNIIVKSNESNEIDTKQKQRPCKKGKRYKFKTDEEAKAAKMKQTQQHNRITAAWNQKLREEALDPQKRLIKILQTTIISDEVVLL